MARYEFRLPDIGEGLAEAEVARWLVGVGDRVAEDQPVVEMMTDKATVELPAPGDGVMVEQTAAEGDVVKTGAVLYVLEADGQIGVHAPGESEARPMPEAVVGAPGEAASVFAPPAVRKLARELGVDLAQVKGSGPGGRISAEDVQRHVAASDAALTPAPAAGAGRRERLRGVRKRMAETMAESARTIAHVTGFHEVEAGSLVELASRLRRAAEKVDRRFPFDTLLVRAAAIALREHPIFNSSLDAAAGEILFHDDVNIGVATATREGLIVPVVKNADSLDLETLAAEVDRIASAARDGKTALADLQGGTFTISNTGAWRGGFGTSLIRPPEVALVAFGRVEEKAVVRDGQIVARAIIPMSVTFDHRVIDGEQGLAFALTLRRLIEEPLRLEQ
jgi:pyruvate/2-oxoglutarate dehydrogenase complex dihydrolipoamide acyltransferase (E2) component